MMKRMTCFSGALPLLLLLAALPMLPSCHQEDLSVRGGEIVFGASTTWRNGSGTRTEYTGLDGSGMALIEGSLEQIHWLSSDKIRILSAQATSAYGAGVQHADYVVTPKSDAREGGIAPLTSSGSTVNAKGLQWGTTFPHVFYAVYPSPQQSDKVSVSLSGGNAVVSASIPAAQTGSWAGDTYKPDMDYAYMWSVVSASSKGDVELSFRPLVTAFEVSLLAEDAAMAAKTLTGVSLSSSAGGAALSGSFSATLTPTTAAGTPPVVSVAASPAPGTSVGITFPASDGVHLSQTSAKQFTLFALPVDQSQLTLTLTFSDVPFRSLKLKDADAVSASNPDGWIPIAASKKMILKMLSVPGDVSGGGPYTFAGLVIAPGDLYDDNGTLKIAGTWDGFTPSPSNNVTYFSWQYLWESVLTTDRVGATYNLAESVTGSIDLPVGGTGTSYTWRLPSAEEWEAIFGSYPYRNGSTVNDVSGCRYAFIQLDNNNRYANTTQPLGMLLFPDDITMSPSYTLPYYNVYYSINVGVTESQLREYLDAGCVFLPCTGFAYGGYFTLQGSDGYYLSNSSQADYDCYIMTFNEYDSPMCAYNVKTGMYVSTRLVRDP